MLDYPPTLESIPVELLIEIEELLTTAELSRLLLANSHINRALTPRLYSRSKAHSTRLKSANLDRLIAFKARPSATPPLATALHYAASAGNTCAIQKLLDAGFSVNAPCPGRKLPPLIHAAAHGHAAAARLLLERGADVNCGPSESASPGHCASTPLLLAIKLCHEEVFHVLLQHGAVDGIIPRTVLHYACQDGRTRPVTVPVPNGTDVRLRMMRELLKRGFPIDGRDLQHKTPLHIACTHRAPHPLPAKLQPPVGHVYQPDSVAIVEFLLDYGADVKATDCLSATPLHYAIQEGRCDIAKVLVAAGADVNAQDVQGQTPLHYVWSRSREAAASCAEFLLGAGAKLEIKDSDGNTVLSSLHGYHDYATWGAVNELYLKRGGTPITAISDSYFWDYDSCFSIMKVLLRYGAKAEESKLKDMRVTLGLWEEYGRKLIEVE
jgi:ankyrin repeat protein